ncbi:MAG: hypothetical protein IT438_04245 [Phycisphaerales bacterium]|nr:hypothetical protein [Phycisphaerales bacterium]
MDVALVDSRVDKVRRSTMGCPRCGYDLSGAAAVRSGERGVCSECGLEFLWADVLDPSRRRSRWLYDHAVTEKWWRRPRIWRAIRTLAASAAPWWFWKRVDVHQPVGVGRLLLWLVVLIVPLHVAWSVSITVIRLALLKDAYFGKMPKIFGTEYELMLVNSWCYQIGELVGSRATGLSWRWMPADASATIPLGVSIGVPAMLLILTRSRAAGRGGRVRAVHVLRAGIYGMSWAVAWYLFWTVRSILTMLSLWWPGLEPPRLAPWMQIQAVKWGVNHQVFGNPRVWLGAMWVAWLGAWWWFALRRGFMLKRSLGVWILLMLAALLVGVACAMRDKAFVRMVSEWVG